MSQHCVLIFSSVIKRWKRFTACLSICLSVSRLCLMGRWQKFGIFTDDFSIALLQQFRYENYFCSPFCMKHIPFRLALDRYFCCWLYHLKIISYDQVWMLLSDNLWPCLLNVTKVNRLPGFRSTWDLCEVLVCFY